MFLHGLFISKCAIFSVSSVLAALSASIMGHSRFSSNMSSSLGPIIASITIVSLSQYIGLGATPALLAMSSTSPSGVKSILLLSVLLDFIAMISPLTSEPATTVLENPLPRTLSSKPGSLDGPRL